MLVLPALLVAQMLFQLAPVAVAASVVGVTATVSTVPGAHLAGLSTAYPGVAQDLSAAGSTDWTIWGTGSSTSLIPNNRKSGGSAISDLTDVVGPPPASGTITRRALGGYGPGSTPFTFAWTNGVPAVSGSGVTSGLQHNQSATGQSQVGYGYGFTVPAGTVSQRLTLWIHSHGGTGRLNASVSGGTATVSDTGVTGGENQPGIYTIDFLAGSNGETMTVSYVMDSVGPPSSAANFNNVAIYAAALSPTPGGTVAAPILYQAGSDGDGGVLVRGRLTAAAATSYTLEVMTSNSCISGLLGGEPTSLGTFTALTGADGNAYFDGLIGPSSSLGTYVTARVMSPGSSSPSTCIVAGGDNDTWTRAKRIDVGSTPGYIDDAGRARWYKVAIEPGARIHLTLSGLPADYDMFAFRDINQVFTALANNSDLTKLSAEFAPSAFSPSAFSPSAFSPSAFSPLAFSPSAFSPSAFSPSAFSPSAFSPSAFSPSAFSPSAFSPSAFSPSAFSPSAFSPSAFSPSAFSPSAFSADTYASAQIRSLITGSANPGTTPESITADTWDNTGDFYIRINGKNGAFDLNTPFTLTVAKDASVCTGVVPIAAGAIPVTVTGRKTLILQDTTRMPDAVPGNSATDQAALQTKLELFVPRPEVLGATVNVSDYSWINLLNAQADLHKSCMYAKNLVASAIREVVAAYRTANPGLEYIVIVGGDHAIPFVRYPDQALLGPEKDFAAPVQTGTASEASLKANYVLGQDAYGSLVGLSVQSADFPVPDLAVGRLVETAAEAGGMLDAYGFTTDGTVETTSSLTTGYDFLSDAATAVNGDLAAGLGTGATVDTLISNNTVAPQQLCDTTHVLPNCSWDATALGNSLLNSRHDLIYLAGHFSANNALAADNATTLSTAALFAPTTTASFVNSIVFSAGCHSGYNVLDPDAVSGGEVDWAQALARKQATLIGGTGYQYGDTDFLEYSERIYAEFAHQLRIGSGPVSIGQALMRSKQIYLASTPDPRGIHAKALLESTLFGLPMLSVNMPSGRIPAPTTGTIVPSTTGFLANPGLDLGLQSATVTITPTFTEAPPVVMTNYDSTGTTTATYLRGSNGVVTNPGEPAIPLESRDVTVSGKVLRGVGFRGGAYIDQSVIPLTGAPADPNLQIRGVHGRFASPVFWPMRLATPNYFDALGDGGQTRLLITPVQHRATGDPDGTNTRRKYTNLELQLFYSSNTSPAARSGAPTLSGVSANVVGGNVTFSTRAIGDPRAGMQKVWVTYTGNAPSWTSLDLVQSVVDSTLWTRTIPLPAALPGKSIQYLVQAVNGFGLVTMDDNIGRAYSIGTADQAIIFAPLPDQPHGASDFAIAATATSGLPVLFTASGPCTVSGSTVHVTGSGMCSITGSQAGNGSFNAATSVTQNFRIRTGQTITFAMIPDKTYGDADFAIVASSTNTGAPPITFSAGATDQCTVTGSSVHIVAAGSCSITASQAGDSVFDAATSVTRIFAIAKKDQVITIVVPSLARTFGDPDFAVSATTTSPLLPVNISASGSCTLLAGGMIHITGVNACTITATQDGDSNWNAQTSSIVVMVSWPFTGFLQPVDNNVINTATAGQAIPVKFRLGGNRTLAIFKTGYPKATITTCGTGATDAIEETVTANTSGLQYDAASSTYSYVWKTDKTTMAGKCVKLELGLIDGSTKIANFRFK